MAVKGIDCALPKRKEKGNSLGVRLLRDAMLRTVQAANIGVLSAKDENAKNFYEKYGFELSPTNELHQMLSIKDIRANLI